MSLEENAPFPGLRPFSSEESELFFGREGQSDALAARMGETRFVAVVGASGSGKSSLVWAGLIPSLQEGRLLSAGARWRVVKMRPGDCPIDNLATGLREAIPGSETSADALRSNSLALLDFVRGAYSSEQLQPEENLLLLVDQFEELFRYQSVAGGQGDHDETMRDRDEKSAFVKLLLEGCKPDLRLYIVITMRSDFLGDCARFRDLPEAINRGQYLIPRMTRDQRRKAIEGPVRMAGQQIAPRLVQRILNDAGEDPDQLPVMQHALMRTWDHWNSGPEKNRPLDIEDYDAIGAMQGALSKHAEEALEDACRKLPGRGMEIVQRVFQLLRETDASGRQVRRPTPLTELRGVTEASDEDVLTAVESFRRSETSFLMPPLSVDLRYGKSLDITHEALLRKWERLQGPPAEYSGWLAEEAESRRMLMRLVDLAEQSQGGEPDYLRGPLLHLALYWWEKRDPNEAWARRYTTKFADASAYLKASQESEQRETQRAEENKKKEEEARLHAALQDEELKKGKRKSRLLTGLLAALCCLIVLMIGAVLFSYRQVSLNRRQNATIRRNDELIKANAAQLASLREQERRQSDEEQHRLTDKNAELQTAKDKAQTEERKAEVSADKAEASSKEAFTALTLSNALRNLGAQPDLALLLAVEASRGGDGLDSSSALLQTLQSVSHLQAVLPVNAPDLAQKLRGTEAESQRWDDLNSGSQRLTRNADKTSFSLAPSAFLRTHLSNLSALQAAITNSDVPASGNIFSVPVAASGDGNFLALGLPTKVVLWDVKNHKRTDIGPPLESSAMALALSRDGGMLAFSQRDGSVVVRDIHHPDTPGAPKSLRAAIPEPPTILLFDKSAHYLAGGYALSPTASVWNLSSAAPVLPYSLATTGRVTALTFKNDSTLLACGSLGGNVIVAHLPQIRVDWNEHIQSNVVSRIVFNNDGDTLASFSLGKVAIWSMTQQSPSHSIAAAIPNFTPEAISFLPGNRIMASGNGAVNASPSSPQKIRLGWWDSAQLRSQNTIELPGAGGTHIMAFSPDGRMFAAAIPNGGPNVPCPKSTLQVSSVTGSPLMKLEVPNLGVSGIGFSPDSREMVVTTCGRGAAEAVSRAQVLRFDLTAGPRQGVPYSADSRMSVVAVGPDYSVAAALQSENAARVFLWEANGKEPRPLEGHRSSPITRLRVTGDGRYIVAVCADGAVLIWDRHTAKQIGQPIISLGTNDVAVSPDGKMLATTSRWGFVGLWDMGTQQMIGTLPTISRDFLSQSSPVAFDPANNGILAVAGTNTISLWDVRPAAWQERACELADRNLTYIEWKHFAHGEYQKTCHNLPIDPSMVAYGTEQALRGNVAEATHVFSLALKLDPSLHFEPARRAQAIAAEGNGGSFEKSDPLKALSAYQAALRLDPSLKITGETWNNLCWNGSLQGHARQMILACEKALAQEPDNTNFRDSRGLARALTGDRAGAVADFKAFADKDTRKDLTDQRRGWIATLQSGGPSPFTPEVLESLKDQ